MAKSDLFPTQLRVVCTPSLANYGFNAVILII